MITHIAIVDRGRLKVTRSERTDQYVGEALLPSDTGPHFVIFKRSSRDAWPNEIAADEFERLVGEVVAEALKRGIRIEAE